MNQALLTELRAVAGEANVLDRLVDLQTYEYDAYGERSLPGAVVFCRSTSEVSEIVKILNRYSVPFVPRGYGTNVNGGSLALFGGVVIEVGRMNQVLEIDVPNRCVVVQSGIFNADVSAALAPYGYYFAPDPVESEGLVHRRQHRRERGRSALLQVRGDHQPRVGARSGAARR